MPMFYSTHQLPQTMLHIISKTCTVITVVSCLKICTSKRSKIDQMFFIAIITTLRVLKSRELIVNRSITKSKNGYSCLYVAFFFLVVLFCLLVISICNCGFQSKTLPSPSTILYIISCYLKLNRDIDVQFHSRIIIAISRSCVINLFFK